MDIDFGSVLIMGGCFWTATSMIAYTRWAIPALKRADWPDKTHPYVRPGMYFGFLISSFVRILDIIPQLLETSDNEYIIQGLSKEIDQMIKKEMER
jgi:hypothetical protein